ncbi:hypothetical protein P296_19160 [Salmonella enterica subsp. arizonae serovar 18:z4,z23:- str. CVM N26624]|uniref:Uncharacterized protein n=1 Tax=Salmonella enterica subsp. arizonae serovar 18:z4,z23:- str. CVM N26626 TaxID=1395119 RepID=A0A3S5YI46_SALER|nr:hypothetical protein P296_19160 [Salmonella enterica subsp. arizonae serovar 18:z4,z23:- str. CVM N26624]OLV97313.1 hypothetical protein P298_18315 [Salmonella enterica subsp. arizonae serovar 18:z4,z23:- str. CVM N26626]OLW00144.1 hypothetical protein P297_13545 [Salmonella enterica subsp. arizonae serovar 18:z4,z23:- str. CVM N26625]OLW06916.1 hypothetical protein P295_02115 [Salmonella enterica subsp. arizonae serovar 18:z4,z23:- str. CVM N25373]OLW10507.1 hypothetical protein P293_17595 
MFLIALIKEMLFNFSLIKINYIPSAIDNAM